MVNGGHYTREALIHFTKAIVLTAGTGLETRSEQQVELMRLFGVTVLVGFVDYLKRLGQLARDMGLEPGRDIPIRMISGHMGAEDPAAISALWGGAEVFDWYGVGDTGVVAAEGPDHNGLYVFEDAHLVEIIDPESGAVLADGAAGNICVTVLFKQAVYPIVRFDTKDVSSIITAPNTIDIGFRRLAGFQGRSDNMIKLRGVNVYPTAIGVHLEGHARATGEFVCKVHRVDHRDEMTVVVEVDRPDAPGLAQEFRELLRQKLGVETGIELVGPGETAALTQIEARQKPIRLIDERAK
jgi:phenylacetate-CoA ligase